MSDRAMRRRPRSLAFRPVREDANSVARSRGNLLEFLQQDRKVGLDRVSRTLTMGREAMEERLVCGFDRMGWYRPCETSSTVLDKDFTISVSWN